MSLRTSSESRYGSGFVSNRTRPHQVTRAPPVRLQALGREPRKPHHQRSKSITLCIARHAETARWSLGEALKRLLQTQLDPLATTGPAVFPLKLPTCTYSEGQVLAHASPESR